MSSTFHTDLKMHSMVPGVQLRLDAKKVAFTKRDWSGCERSSIIRNYAIYAELEDCELSR